MDTIDWFFVFILVYVCCVLALLYAILFGGAARFESGFIRRVHDFFTGTLVQKGQLWMARICFAWSEDPTSRANQALSRGAYIFEKYLMFVAYLGLLVAGLAAAQQFIMLRLPELDQLAPLDDTNCPRTKLLCIGPDGLFTLPPRTSPDAVYVYGVLALASWLAVYLSDPGIIDGRSFDTLQRMYPYDEVLFLSGKECRSCRRPKLPRSKHDSLVGACIARYDHFCGWTGNAIGIYNTNRFCIFLLVHLTMVVHGAALCAELVVGRVLGLIDGQYVYVPTGRTIDRFSVSVAFAAETNLCLFLFMLAMTGVVLFAFLFYHISLIYRNVTTSESSKWSPIQKACGEYLKEHGRSYGDMLRELAEKECAETGRAIQYVPPFDRNGLPVNVYDRGPLNNAIEVLFPRWFIQRAQTSVNPCRRRAE